MLRDPSLIPLSHQHHNGLALCVLTDRDLQRDASDENIARLAQRIVDRFEVELVNHFEVEEQILFPAYDSPLTTELIAEHREMERVVGELRSAPTSDRIREFIALLRRHIRREENDLFEQIQKRLPRQTLDDLGTKIDENVIRVCL